MEAPEPLLILAKNWNQFRVGESWLWQNGFFVARRPIYVRYIEQLFGLRGMRLFIMDEAESTKFAMELQYSNFAIRNRIYDMNDVRDPKELKFKITERVTLHDQSISS